MTVSVNMETGRDPQALVLAAGAIRDPAVSPWTLVVRDGKASRQPVTLGMRGDGKVQVLTGLAPGEWVVSPAATVGPGRRVRTEPAR
jgi:HlyD family secretion protein